jgi:uncharacterized protein (DUF433 family)
MSTQQPNVQQNNKPLWWGDDKLERFEIAKDFTNILETLEPPCTLSINAGYGRGKTFFLERWANDLKDKKHTVFHFNAWENDYSDEPLAAFAMDFSSQLAKAGLKKHESLKDFGLTVVNITESLLVTALPNGLVNNENDRALEKQTAGIAAAKIKAHQEMKGSVEALTDALKKLCAAVKDKQGDEALPIYIMVDELDRCRPTFAIKFLEIIKHFFAIKDSDIIFILAMDKEQLSHAVKSVYGTGSDAQGYLRRFIDLELNLPKPQNSEKFVKAELEKYNLLQVQGFDLHSKIFIESFSEYALFFNLEQRDIEAALRYANIVIRILTNNQNIFVPTLLAFLLVARSKQEDFYRKIGTELNTYDEILAKAESLLEKPDYFTDHQKHKLLKAELIAFLAESSNEVSRVYADISDGLEDGEASDIVINRKSPTPKYHLYRVYEWAQNTSCPIHNAGYYNNNHPPIMKIREAIDVGEKYMA